MKLADLFRFSISAIVAHPMRSVLTALGVVIGVSAVVMMTAIGLGAQQRVQQSIASLGSNLLVVSPGASRGGGGFVSGGAGTGITLTQADAAAIKAQVEDVVAVSPSVRAGRQISAQGANWNTRIEGVTPDYLTARDLSIASGRMFDDRERSEEHTSELQSH